MPVFNRNRHSGSSGVVGAYTIDQSCRFNDDDSAFLTQTFSGSGSQTTWTFSVWYKRANLGAGIPSEAYFITAGSTSADRVELIFLSNDKIQFYVADGGPAETQYQTTQVFRDPASWGHIVVRADTSNGTEADRLKIYHNGVQITSFSTTNHPGSSPDWEWNEASVHSIGRQEYGAARYFDGYLAEVISIDGTALGPDSFGEFDANGNWGPIDPSGLTFGTNGYWLDFAVAPGTGNGAGTDVSGNGNHFTDSGISANDSVKDSPTDDAENDVGNYPTLNPLAHSSLVTLSNGNLVVTGNSGSNNGNYHCTQALPQTGKWYWETEYTYIHAWGYGRSGIVGTPGRYPTDGGNGPGNESYSPETGIHFEGTTRNLDGATSSSFVADPAQTNGDMIAWAVDMDNGAAYYMVEGVWQTSGDPTSGGSKTGAVWTWTPSSAIYRMPGGTDAAGSISTFNFGQSAFETAAPSGYSSLMTANLPAPAITDPSKFFQVDTFTGTGSELVRTLTDAAGGAVKPDLVWIKDRDSAVEHVFTDSVRGATKETNPNDVTAETTVAQGLKSFDTSGYTLGTDTNYNASSSANVAWCWNTQGGAGASNEDGSINTTSTSVGELQGMSFGVFDGTGSNATVGHGLSQAPELVIVHDMDNGNEAWVTQHVAFTGAQSIALNSVSGVGDDPTAWQSTFPTSSVFSIGTNTNTNASGRTYIAWCMHGVEGYSKFDSYVGTSSTDGTFIYCGFTPKWIFAKTTASDPWNSYDTGRDTYNPAQKFIRFDATSAEGSGNYVDFLSNGFKWRSNDAGTNDSGRTYIFGAFAEFPFGGSGVAQARAK